MAVKILMPKIGLNMVEGQINEWLIKEGQTVKKGEIIFIVETDKITNDVEAPADGIVYKILVPEGEVVPVRKIVGVLVDQGEDVDLDLILSEDVGSPSTTKGEVSKKISTHDAKRSSTSTPGQILATPLVKRMAIEQGIDLTTIDGTGPGGRILKQDLEQASLNASDKMGKPVLPGKVIALSGVRKVVAERMAKSSSMMAMVTLNSTLDVTPIVNYRNEFKSQGIEKEKIPSINAVLVSMTAKALLKHPYLNASFEDEGIRLIKPINIGLAVDTQEGLKVVVIRDADKKTIEAIHQEISILAGRAQNNKSKPEDLQGGTFTITNLGMFGVDSFNPIINPPEAGILGIGKFVDNTKNIIDPDAVSQTAVFSLTFDHRVIDGAPAARFLMEIQENISEL